MNANFPLKKQTNWTSYDREMMSLALNLAEKGQYTARPNPMVGCVIVRTDKQQPEIVGQGWHQKSGLPHAEVNALSEAGDKARGATCYVTLEPCAHYGKTGPCTQALIDAGVSKVIAAMHDPNPSVSGKGFKLLMDAGITVEYGLMEAQARKLIRGFVSRFEKKRPWITCKLAMSLDGRTALADGSSQWITGSAARADVQKLRARQDAIITGIGTVLADNPSLNVRAQSDEPTTDEDDWFYQACDIGFSQPARILLDREKRAQVKAKIFNDDAQVFWLSDNFAQIQKENHLTRLSGFESLSEMLKYFAEQQGMNNLLLESGHQLAGEFLKQQLIDELVVYVAPKLMGNQAMGLFDLNINKMQITPELHLLDLRRIGDDIRLTYSFESNNS
ncbi:bifunctional diaminohydroxyphosphoribosylaminopyrimidine deaminase/5-amino-6-(5-phosphoribosylamino)uracil reductase RibD [Aliikangiella coralliicola]|uniref:Riboflavin biosynthesis protein RibD n=1 Tax=Aliikangiella coralliicola TaxID=2592383 RepID=A0A545U744_9GAMM|nr:bifunctional diaminohydroxyphosphoribosylaminopyrimidine deaminase/5-amino-6-(5-phosphoribosylamino)uracil reductase RibD [Aliikangiella coralliicola]TQV85298.1 bifunctional diaminohydroxyphosphoribosylaminopyrimidine deaminase/5-amino-6-(5-phosphoribosylamino)uracil reductase RibD [Aliikangiella coralliicola]